VQPIKWAIEDCTVGVIDWAHEQILRISTCTSMQKAIFSITERKNKKGVIGTKIRIIYLGLDYNNIIIHGFGINCLTILCK